ncbi:hypothetical protein [Geobacter sp.]|nr:hypothetical protein [Geobacter sp.]
MGSRRVASAERNARPYPGSSWKRSRRVSPSLSELSPMSEYFWVVER